MYNMYTHVLCTDECIQDIPNRLMRTAQGGNSVIEQWILFFQTILIPHETQMSVVQIVPLTVECCKCLQFIIWPHGCTLLQVSLQLFGKPPIEYCDIWGSVLSKYGEHPTE